MAPRVGQALKCLLMKRVRLLLTMAGCLALAACSPDADRSVSDKVTVAPRDDYEVIVQRFGPPDADDSTDHDVPRPPIPSRWITYEQEHVRFVFIPDAKLGDAPPYRWRLAGTTDPRNREPIAPAVAVKRLAARDTKPTGTTDR